MADNEGGRKVGMLEQLSTRENPDASRGMLAQLAAKDGAGGKGVLDQRPIWDKETPLTESVRRLIDGTAFSADLPRVSRVLARCFSRPGYISHRGAWKLDVRTMEIILGPGDSLPAVAEDLTGWDKLASTIFPAAALDSRHAVWDRVPLIMKEDTFLRWTKEAWQKAVVGMPWEEYWATIPATRDTLLPTADQIARAFAKGWMVDGTKAMATRAATLEDLAEAITGDRKDSRFLKVGLVGGRAQPHVWIDIMFLLRKAAGLDVKTEGVRPAAEWSLSKEGLSFLKAYEDFVPYAYSDQDKDRKPVEKWTRGATIGYGHLIPELEWNKFKDGITRDEALRLLSEDVKRDGEDIIRKYVKVPLSQQQFDALVAFAFNIGSGEKDRTHTKGFVNSTVLKMINDPAFVSPIYPDLRSAWLAVNKSQGKFMRGLENRRLDEWDMNFLGKYKRSHW